MPLAPVRRPPAPHLPAPRPWPARRSRSGAVGHLFRAVSLRVVVSVHVLTVGRCGQLGQSTVEYALVLLGAAAVALALVAWVTRSDAVGRLFDAVVGRILERAG